MKDKRLQTVKLLLTVALGLVLIFIATASFAAPPPPPAEPVPLFGEEFLIPALVGYGLYRLRGKKSQDR